MLTTLAEKVDPEHAALVVVDVQNDFCDDDGAFARLGRDVKLLHPMVDRLQRLIDCARAAGVLVIFMQYCQNDLTESEVHLEQRSRGRAGTRYCEEGSRGAEFYRVGPKPEEPVVKKHRYSGFVGTDLDVILRSSGIQSLIMTGIATSGCVEATARDGFMLDYYVVVVDDCCGSYSQELHNGTLQNVRDAYGIVASSDEVIATWNTAGEGAR
jgi:ureidoacrylate peracid hydrolase